MDEFVEVEVSVRVRVLSADEVTTPERSRARSAALQAISNAVLKAEGDGFDHDHAGDLSIVVKDTDLLSDGGVL